MSTLTRITIDLVTDEELSQRRMDTIAREMTENLHLLLVEKEDGANVKVDKYVEAHVHDTSEGDRCGMCLGHSKDWRNGDIVVANS